MLLGKAIRFTSIYSEKIFESPKKIATLVNKRVYPR
jgi:hypothetical protein